MSDTLTLKQMRQLSGSSTNEIAAYMGVTDRTILMWESGGAKISAENLFKLMSFYGRDANISELDRIIPSIEIKKDHRICYDFLFLAHDPIETKEEIISGLSIMVMFKLFDQSGKEILFDSKTQDEILLDQLPTGRVYACDLVKCSYDPKAVVKIEAKNKWIKELFGDSLTIDWEIIRYQKDVMIASNTAEQREITKEEFMKIAKTYSDRFNNSDNQNAQTTAFMKAKIEKRTP